MLIASVQSYAMQLAKAIAFFAFLSLIIASSAFADSACELSTPQWSEMEIRTVRLVRDDGKEFRLRSRIADTSRERSAGFQHICPEIIELSSILFVYKKPTTVGFHMFNVHDNLDIGFFDQNLDLISVLRMTPQNLEDGSSVTYGIGSRSFLYALEVRENYFQEHGLKPNTTKLIYP